MKTIRKLRDLYAGVFILTFSSMGWFVVSEREEIAFLLGAVSLVLLVLFMKQNRMLNDAALILDNSILAVPSVTISKEGDRKNNVTETVVSTFGILIGSKIYRWGLDGLYGVRLKTVMIDKEKLYLSFGDELHNLQVELLHGMVRQQEVMRVTNKFLDETGISPIIIGW